MVQWLGLCTSPSECRYNPGQKTKIPQDTSMAQKSNKVFLQTTGINAWKSRGIWSQKQCAIVKGFGKTALKGSGPLLVSATSPPTLLIPGLNEGEHVN